MPFGQQPSFPTYLLPSLSFPFRRRQSTSTSEPAEQTLPPLSLSPVSSADTTPSSSPLTNHYLPIPPKSKSLDRLPRVSSRSDHGQAYDQGDRLSVAQPSTLRCKACATDIAYSFQILSKGFTGRHGRAYLVAPPSRDILPPSDKRSSIPQELVNIKIGRSVNRELLTGAHVVADVSCVICETVLGWKYVDAKESSQRYKIGKFILETKRVVVAVCWEDDMRTGMEKEELYSCEANNSNGIIVFDSEDEDECEDLFAGVWDPDLVAKRRAQRLNYNTRKRSNDNG